MENTPRIYKIVQTNDSLVVAGWRQVIYITHCGKTLVHFEC
jgi:hypothetical protein